MPRKHYPPEEIIKLLRLVEIEVGKGKQQGRPVNNWALPSKVIIAGAKNTEVCKSTRQNG